MGKNKKKKHHKSDSIDCAEIRGTQGLKLILKVGNSSSGSILGCTDVSESQPLIIKKSHKRKKKKKEKKKDKDKKHHKHHRKRKHYSESKEVESEGDGREVKKLKSDSFPTSDKVFETSPLTKLLDYILPLLEKRDSNNFFAFPVSDKFAPGYSRLISNPMDFSTIKGKLEKNEYLTLGAFKNDFELMCTNAMTYNQQDTIYYKAAKKLLQLGQRVLTPERLRPLAEHFPFMKDLSSEELGFELENYESIETDVQTVIEDIREEVKRPLGRFEAIPDELTPAEILEQAQKAAASASEKLKHSGRGKTRMGTLVRSQSDGSTTLCFLPGTDGIIPGTERDRPVSLGSLIGKVKQGTGAIRSFGEDRHNLAKAVYPLYYGAYSSHGPSYDSTFSNLTKEETDLILSTYGDEVGVQYAESIMNFGRDCDYAMFIVDHLLDILTGNEHRKTSSFIEQEKNGRLENEVVKNAINEENKIDIEALKTLSEEGIDMSFLNNIKKEDLEPKSVLLEQNALLIQELKTVQTERLSANPPQHFSQMMKPSEKEEELAEKIRMNLTNMTKTVTPQDVITEKSIKKMLGVY